MPCWRLFAAALVIGCGETADPTNAPLDVVLDNLLSPAETIEATYGSEDDDLFTLG